MTSVRIEFVEGFFTKTAISVPYSYQKKQIIPMQIISLNVTCIGKISFYEDTKVLYTYSSYSFSKVFVSMEKLKGNLVKKKNMKLTLKLIMSMVKERIAYYMYMMPWTHMQLVYMGPQTSKITFLNSNNDKEFDKQNDRTQPK